jgi:class 3 adenylate cyclase
MPKTGARSRRNISATRQRRSLAVAKYLGDGLMVYFGWPQEHEDDAERAVRAGLAIVHEVAALNEAWPPNTG